MLALIGAENMLFVLAFGGYTIGWGQSVAIAAILEAQGLELVITLQKTATFSLK